MTDRYDDEYHGHCPDKLREAFEMGVREIIENARRTNRIRQSIKYPSKVKRELEQLDNALRKLSLEARSSLWDTEVDTPFSSPLLVLQKRIGLAVGGHRTGRSKRDAVRQSLGRDAASLWTTHGGDINASEFLEFLEELIDAAGFGGDPLGGGKVRIDSTTLAEEMREKFARCAPPRWDRF
jgi:hypothetical protein